MSAHVRVYSAEEVREHVLFLHNMGFSDSSISRLAGIAKSDTVGRIRRGVTTRVNVKTAEGILAVTADDRGPHDKVSGADIRRLVYAVKDAGLSTRIISDALGYRQHYSIWTMCNPRHRVTKRQYDRVALIVRYLASRGLVPADVLEVRP